MLKKDNYGFSSIIEVVTGPVLGADLGVHMQALKLLFQAMATTLTCTNTLKKSNAITHPFFNPAKKFIPASILVDKYNALIGETAALQDWKLDTLP